MGDSPFACVVALVVAGAVSAAGCARTAPEFPAARFVMERAREPRAAGPRRAPAV